MKKDKTKTTGYYLATIFLSLLLFITIAIASKSIFNRWFSDNEIDAIQYNEMINYQQLQGNNVCSDGKYVIIKTNKIIVK